MVIISFVLGMLATVVIILVMRPSDDDCVCTGCRKDRWLAGEDPYGRQDAAIEHTITPTSEEFRTRIKTLETAVAIADPYLEHRENLMQTRCLADCPKCRIQAVLAAR